MQTKRGKIVRSSRFQEWQKEQISCSRITASWLNPERRMTMDTYRDQKIRPTVISQPEADDDANVRPTVNLNQSNQNSNGIVAIIVAAIVVIAGAYFLFSGGPSTQTTAPVATQNSAPAPAPSATEKVTPVPATPPASNSTAAPATPLPATGTTPKAPVAPAQ
jgi:hypothetical protein